MSDQVINHIGYEELERAIAVDFGSFCEHKITYLNQNFLSVLFGIQLIYMLMHDDKIVYIGQTNELGNRLFKHIKMKKQFNSVSVFEVEKCEADIIEASLINIYNRAKYNMQEPSLSNINLKHELPYKSKKNLFLNEMNPFIKKIYYAELLEVLENKTTHFSQNWLTDLFYTYVIYSLLVDDDVVYIGRTNSLVRRMNNHILDGKNYNNVCFFNVDRNEARDIEAIFIRLFKPKFNKEIPLLLSEKKIAKKYRGEAYSLRRQINSDKHYISDPEYRVTA